MRSNPLIREVTEKLNAMGIDYALLHQLAISAWNLDYSVSLWGADIVVPSETYSRLFGDSSAPATMGLDAPVDLRVWDDTELLGCDFRNHDVWSPEYACRILEPELVLSLLPCSPDYRFLLEQRARLAEVLYFDRMTDTQLAMFHRYVRGD